MDKGTAPLPGFEDQVHEDIRDAALLVFNARADTTAAKGREKVEVEKLMVVMQEHGARSYFDKERNLTVKIEESEHVVVLLGEKKIGQRKDSPVTSPGPDAPISEQTMRPVKKLKPNAGVPRGEKPREKRAPRVLRAGPSLACDVQDALFGPLPRGR